jgi:ankyrin repeat protein
MEQTNVHESQLREIFCEITKSLFVDNDYKPFFRMCRLNIRKNPEFLHTAIRNNYSELLSKFIPVAGKELMQKKNQDGETVLLHAARLNRLPMVKVALERKESDQLLEDIDNKGRNIFHILALTTNSDEILNLIIDYLLKKSIDIFKKFDQMDDDNYTPLQLAVLNNNLPVIRRLLKYFDKNKSNHTGENLIHLAVRHGDLTILKYLLNEGQLIEQGNRTSLTMTPIELAQSLNHTDMVNYLKELYPQPEINEDENSDND